MTWSHFDYSVDDDGVALLELARPQTLNSLTFEVYEDLVRLTDGLRSGAERDRVRVLVLTGRGRGFCSGGNIDEIIGPLLERSTEEVLAFTRMTCAVIRNMRAMPQPIVAAVNGTTAGAGAVLALASDLRVVAEGTKIHFLFTKVGLTGADMGAAWLLPRVIGHGRASEVLLFGDPITSAQALAWGLANRVAPPESVLSEAMSWATRLARGPQEALRATKRAMAVEAEMSLDAALEHETAMQALMLRTADHREFYDASKAGREPRWGGRQDG